MVARNLALLSLLALSACPSARGVGDARPEAAPGPTPCELAGAARVETLATLVTGRRQAAIALLPSGEVLVVGGLDATGTPLASVERIALAPPVVRGGPPLAAPRASAGSAIVGGGLLLVGGLGVGGGALRSLELLEPTSGLSRPLGATLHAGREAPALAPLSDGSLLISGGRDPGANLLPAALELYAPATETLALLPATLGAPRVHHASLPLAPAGCGASDAGVRDGGGRDGGGRDAAARVDALRDRAVERGACPTGAVLIAGGEGESASLASLELVRADGALARLLPDALPQPAAALAAAPLPDGRVLLAGGRSPERGPLAGCSIYDPASERLLAAAPLPGARSDFTLTALPDGRLLAAGGLGAGGPLGSLALYDPALGLWQTLPVALTRARYGHAALLLPDCRVLIAGGSASSGPGAEPALPRELELVTVPARRGADR